MMHYNGIGNDVLVVGGGEKMLKARTLNGAF